MRPSEEAKVLAGRAADFAQRVRDLRAALGKVVIGQDTLIFDLLVGVLAGGHVLLEGLPGLGKTRLAHALAAGLGAASCASDCVSMANPALLAA